MTYLSKILLILAFSLLSLEFAGADTPRGQTLIIHSHMPTSMDPAYATTAGDYQVLQQMFEGLVTFDVQGRLVPGQAESWDIQNDGHDYIFHLRDDLEWSDGAPVTADDFVLGFRRAVDPELDEFAKASYLLRDIRNGNAIRNGDLPVSDLGISAIDDKTLKVSFENPAPYALLLLGNGVFAPAPSHVIAVHGNDWTSFQNIVVNGPYKLLSPPRSDQIELQANPAYWGGPPVSKQFIRFIQLDDDSVSIGKLGAGEVDIVSQYKGTREDWLRNVLGARVVLYPKRVGTYFTFNLDVPKLQDIRVRRAINLALLRDEIARRISVLDDVQPTYTFAAPAAPLNWQGSVPDWATDKDGPALLDEARELMRQAGYGPDKRMRLSVRYDEGENSKLLVNAAKSLWHDIYIDIDERTASLRDHYIALQDRDFEVARAGWGPDYDDPATFLNNLATGAVKNYSGWSAPEYDALLEKLDTTYAPDARRAVVEALERRILTEMPIVPVYFNTPQYVYAKDVAPIPPAFYGAFPARYF